MPLQRIASPTKRYLLNQTTVESRLITLSYSKKMFEKHYHLIKRYCKTLVITSLSFTNAITTLIQAITLTIKTETKQKEKIRKFQIISKPFR